MDDYEAMIARARERREALQLRLKATMSMLPTKRHVEITEESENVNPQTTTSNDGDDSPNKRCCKELENVIPLPASSDSLPEESADYSLRRAKFATLARNISSWEDDLSSPSKKKITSPSKVWKPPSECTEPLTDAGINPVQSVGFGKAVKNSSSTKPSSVTTCTKTKEVQVIHKLNTHQNEAAALLSSKSSARPLDLKAVGNGGIKKGGMSNMSEREKVKVASSAFVPNARSVVPIVSATVRSQDASVPVDVQSFGNTDYDQLTEKVEEQSSRRESDVNEPTRQPISARMAAWKKMTSVAEEESKYNTQRLAAARSQRSKDSGSGKNAGLVPSSNSKVVTSKVGLQGENARVTVSSKLQPSEEDDTIQKKIQRKVEVTVPVATFSPKKLGQATLGIQDKLTAMCENWKKNEIAEKSRQERAAELALLENRWKNGVLVEEDTLCANRASAHDVIHIPEAMPCHQTPNNSSRGTVPQPPPVPGEWSQGKPVQRESCTQKQPATTSVDKKKEPELISQVASILENNLIAMGFEKSSGGAVATLPRTTESSPVITRMQKARSAVDINPRLPPAKSSAETLPSLTGTGNRVVPTTTEAVRPGGLYRIVKEQVQAMKNPSAIDRQEPVDEGVSGHEQPNGMKHTASVFFCEAKNMVIAASSAEESFSSVEDSHGPATIARDDGDSHISDERTDLERPDYDDDESDNSCDTDDDDDDNDDSMECSSSDKSLRARSSRKVDRHSSYRRRKPLHVEPSDSDTSSSEPDKQCEVSTTSDNYPMRDYDTDRTRGGPVSSRQHEISSSKRSIHGDLRSQKPSAPMADDLPIEESSDLEIMYRKSAALPKKRLDYDSGQCSDRNNPKNIPPSNASKMPRENMTSNLRSQHAVTVSKKAISSQIQGLKEMAAEEEHVLMQASNALSHCIKSATHGSTSSFVGSAEAVECHRLLLVSMKKRESFLTELKRLREGQGTPISASASLGSLTMSNIRVPIKPEFMAKIGTIHDTSVHHFFVLLRNGVNVVASRRFCTQESMVLGRLDVPGEITLNCVPCDFTPSVYLEVYAMAVSRDRALSLTPKKIYKANYKSKDVEQAGIRGSSFVLIAQLLLDVHSLSKTHFPLNGVTYSCPLKGTIHAKLTLLPETNTFFRGYLNLYSDEAADGWNRYWCVLFNDRVSMWNHQTAELYKDPIGNIDLCQCVTEHAVAGCFGSSTSPTCVELVTVKNTTGKLVKHHSENISTVRHWLIADSVQECAIWCSRFNRVLEDLRQWHPYALPSVRMPSSKSSNQPR